MDYRSFVKQHMASMPSSMSPKEKMKKIGEMWRASGHSAKKPVKGGKLPSTGISLPKYFIDGRKIKYRGGDIEEQPQQQEEETISKGLQLGKPFIDEQTMINNGLPPYLAQHPNVYSGNLNNVLLFNNTVDFLNSSFYKKYESKIVYKKPIKQFGGSDVEFDVPAKKLRIVFHSTSPSDKSVWYIDPIDTNEWLQIMNDAKESYLLTPVEFVSALKIKNIRETAAKQAQENLNTWNQAFDKGQEEGFQTGYAKGKEEGYQEGKSDSSSSSWLDTAADFGKAALSFI